MRLRIDFAQSASYDPAPMLAAPENEQPLPQLDGYNLIEEAGRGGMGVVYRGTQRATGRPVAVKLLASELAVDPTFVQRFDREALALATLAHPGIVRFLDRAVCGGNHFLVMEWVEGESLTRRIDTKRVPPADALGWMMQLLDALEYAHDKGVIHRDIKPQNILLAMDGSVKLTDFGLAFFWTEKSLQHNRLTRSHARMGSFDYMPPEQRKDARNVDPRVDLYSAGVVLYQLLTGELPVGRFSLPSQLVPALPAALDAALLKALEADPARRHSGARQMREALAEAAGDTICRAGAVRPTPRAPSTADMLAVPGGPFCMGGPGALPEHSVELPSFLIDRSPVTNADYRLFVEATGHPEPRYWLDASRPDVPIEPQMPVVGVSWEDAREFAEWAGKRLPSEAEWEKAARGADGRRYPWGPQPDRSRCNCLESGPGHVLPAGGRAAGASPCGAQDMLGNVLEWTSSLDAPYPYVAGDGREEPLAAGKRVLRGGSWFSHFDELACWNRYPEIPRTRMPNVGFRCALDL